MSTRQIVYVAVLAAMYVVIGQVIRLPNPMVPGAIIAINMVVVVIAGAQLGPTAGALVGFVGTLLNAVSPAGNAFEFAAIVPHTIMGLTAGLLARVNVQVAALAIIVGHALNITAFLIAGLLPLNQLAVTIFSVGLLAETAVDIVIIWLAVGIPRQTSPSI